MSQSTNPTLRLAALSAQMSAPAKPPVTCHVLDTTIGRPAPQIQCTLLQFTTTKTPAIESSATVLATGYTNSDGRVTAWECKDGNVLALQEGAAYKMRFEVEEYFKRSGQETFFPFVEVAFRVGSTKEHYHIPLLLAGWSYSTYRGS
jgi:5-hydroxyisourate hydrolase